MPGTLHFDRKVSRGYLSSQWEVQGWMHGLPDGEWQKDFLAKAPGWKLWRERMREEVGFCVEFLLLILSGCRFFQLSVSTCLPSFSPFSSLPPSYVLKVIDGGTREEKEVQPTGGKSEVGLRLCVIWGEWHNIRCLFYLTDGDTWPYHIGVYIFVLTQIVLLCLISPYASRLYPVRVGAPFLCSQDTVFNYWFNFLTLPLYSEIHESNLVHRASVKCLHMMGVQQILFKMNY